MFGLPTERGKRAALFLLPLFFLFLTGAASALNATNVTAYNSPVDGVKLPLYLLILGLAVGFIFLGAFSNSPLLASAGLVALLFASFIMLEGQVLVPTGEVYETYMYGNNFTGYHWDYDAGTAPDGPQVDAYLFHKNETAIYEAWDDGNNSFLGFVMVVVTIILMFSLVAGLQDD